MSAKINEELTNNYDPNLVYQLIHLIYSTNPDGNIRKLTLNEKWNKLNIKNDLTFSNLDISMSAQKESGNLPNILFIIGLFLGDGSIYFNIVNSKSIGINTRITIDIPICWQNHDWSINLLKLIATSLDLLKNIVKHKNNRLVTLKYRDSKSLEKILNLFLENTNYMFRKKSDILIIVWSAKKIPF